MDAPIKEQLRFLSSINKKTGLHYTYAFAALSAVYIGNFQLKKYGLH